MLYPGFKIKLKEVQVKPDGDQLEVKDVEIDFLNIEPSLNRRRSNSVANMSKVEPPVKEKPVHGRTNSGAFLSPRKADSESLRKQLRASLSKGGDIADIDEIFKNVLK